MRTLIDEVSEQISGRLDDFYDIICQVDYKLQSSDESYVPVSDERVDVISDIVYSMFDDEDYADPQRVATYIVSALRRGETT